MKRNCTNCKFGYTYDVGYSNYTIEGTLFDRWLFKLFGYTYDVGYSNYTIEGTLFDCYKDFNPNFPIDFASWEDHNNEIYNYAIECAGYINGDGPHYYVEDSIDPKDFK